MESGKEWITEWKRKRKGGKEGVAEEGTERCGEAVEEEREWGRERRTKGTKNY